MISWQTIWKFLQNFPNGILHRRRCKYFRKFKRKQSNKKSKVQILQMAVAKTRPFTVLVEGNIGCGKTTFLQHFAKVCKTFFKIDKIL